MTLTKSKPSSIFTPQGNSLALFIDVNDGVLKLKDVFGDIALFSDVSGGGGAGLKLKDDALMTGTLTQIADKDNTPSALSVSTVQAKVESASPTPFLVKSFGGGVLLSLSDGVTTSDVAVGIGAIADDLTFISGSVLRMRLLSNGNLTLLGNKLTYFTPSITQDNISAGQLVVDSFNQASFCGSVYKASGGWDVRIDATVVEGFNMSVIQTDGLPVTFLGSGGLTLRNRSGHTKSGGQWAVCTLFREGNNLILAGDTSA
jgi:hypothetical protein